MFTRVHPDMEPNYAETPELFVELWEEGLPKSSIAHGGIYYLASFYDLS